MTQIETRDEQAVASYDELRARAAKHRELCLGVKKMIVDRLDLPIDPAWITDDQPLIARGLELDSVDILELIIGLEAVFGAALTDEEVGAFGSVARLVERIEADQPLDSPRYEAAPPPELAADLVTP
jgi:acyl carrier protein